MPQIFLIEYLRQKFVFMLWNQLYSPCFRFTVTRVFLLPRNLSDFCLTVMFRYYLWISKRKSSDISWFLTNFEGFLAPRAGLEPATSWLTVMRSTDWANEDYEILHKVCVRFFWYSVRLTLCNAEQLHYRLSYGGIYASKACLCWHLPIFTPRRQGTIFGTTELNFRVRYGNGWTLCVIDTN